MVKTGIECWCVVGDSGEYSDWRMWLVAAFDTEDEAQEWADRAQKWAETECERLGALDWDKRPTDGVTGPFDPNEAVDGYETPRYSVHKLDPLQVPSSKT